MAFQDGVANKEKNGDALKNDLIQLKTASAIS